MSNQNTANQTGKSCKEGKWTLGHYQMLRGEFANHTGSYNTPDEACASVGMKAWSYDPKLNKYVPYDPKYGCCRAECGKTSSIGTIYTAAFRHNLALTCTSGGKEFKQTQPADSLIKVAARAGREIGVSANQPVVWKVTKGSELLRNLTILASSLHFEPLGPLGTIGLLAASVCEVREFVLQLMPDNLPGKDSGQKPSKRKNNPKPNLPTLTLTEQDIIDLIKLSSLEVDPRSGDTQRQTAGVVDAVLNRAFKKGGDGHVREVINIHKHFTSITKYGGVQYVPDSEIKAVIKDVVLDHLQNRANGEPSIIGGHTHYLNEKESDSASKVQWGNAVIKYAKEHNLYFGKEGYRHYHGTPPPEKPAKEFNVHIPKSFFTN